MKFFFTISVFLLLISVTQATVISYLRFEDGSGFSATDETGLMDGEMLGFTSVSAGAGDMGGTGWSTNTFAPLIPQTGEANNGSVRFGPGKVDVTTLNALSLGTEFTIEMYLRPDEPGLGSPIYGFSPVSSLGLVFSDSLGDLFFNLDFQGVNPPPVPANTVQIGVWQHLAVVKKPGEYSIFLDGTLLINTPLAASADGPYFFPGSPFTGDRVIGDGFGGWLDEFRISDEALTPDQFLGAFTSVPEPSSLTLLILGGFFVLRKVLITEASQDS